MRPSHLLAIAAVTAAVCGAAATAHAQSAPPGVFNAPIAFALPGSVTLTLDESEGGFDHVLELAAAPGAVGAAPLLALTSSADPSASVLGWTPAPVGTSVPVGSFGAAQEIVLRLTNVGSARLGDPGVVDSQTFSGSASTFNPQPAMYYTLVEWLSPTEVKVYWEDIFPADPQAAPTTLDGYDVAFTLTLAPVPEPGMAALWLAGLGLMGWMAGRRR